MKLPRPDVNEALGIAGDSGFEFAAARIEVGDEVELYALTPAGLTLVDRKLASAPNVEENFLNQLAAAQRIAALPDSIAVVCWDGAHNPVGRAKVLYDVSRTKRPAVLFTYLFDEFGGQLWAPLQSTDVDIVTIPRRERHLYHRALGVAGVKFDTVWICKPRLPSFELARAVASDEARLILDFDDNEEHFSRSPHSRDKPFGTSAISLTRNLLNWVTSRTVASTSLRDDFGGHVVRHARREIPRPIEGRPLPQLRLVAPARVEPDVVDVEAMPEIIRISDLTSQAVFDEAVEVTALPTAIGFIGTARAHKAIMEAARAVQLFRFNTGRNVELHVYGDIQPQALRDELADNGVVVKQKIPMSELGDHLLAMDVILTGFPSPNDREVTNYQISSKIGDALAAGKPVLVPHGPSTADLEGTPGVFLFDELSFPVALASAIDSEGEIELPDEFTLQGAYSAFEIAEAEAEKAPRAAEALSALPPWDHGRVAPAPAILLIWKQQDAGVYGRRIDQIARSYRAAFPDQRVIILEFMHASTVKAYEPRVSGFLGEEGMLLHLSGLKSTEGWDDGGVEVRQIVYSSSQKLRGEVEQFLLSNYLLPTNTKVVLFPLIKFFEDLIPSFREYPKIVDVVDNQFSWGADADAGAKRLQYAALFREADRIVFNSKYNADFFAGQNLIGEKPVSVVKNWYNCPPGFQLGVDRRGSRRRILYSGNMKDRIDWPLMFYLASLQPDLELHLAGTANVDTPQVRTLLEMDNVIFHGPLEERQTLSLLETIDVAIMPHKADEVSNFMNPLKVHMYIAAGVPVVATQVLGIEDHALLTMAASNEEFVATVRRLLKTRLPRIPATQHVQAAKLYNDIIAGVQ